MKIRSPRDWSLFARIATLVAVAIGLFGLSAAWLVMRISVDDATDALAQSGASITGQAEAVQTRIGQLARDGTLPLSHLAEEAEAELQEGRPYSETRLFDALPIVMGWRTAEESARSRGFDFRVIGAPDRVRNPDNAVAPDSPEGRLLARLDAAVRSGSASFVNEVDHEAGVVRAARAITLDGSCLMCHGVPGSADDLDGDGVDPLGFPMEGWASGDMHGAYLVSMPLQQAKAAAMARVGTIIGKGVVFGLVMLGLVAWALRAWFAAPMGRMTQRLESIASGDGDLSQRLDDSKQDELGDAARACNRLIDMLCGLVSGTRSRMTDVGSGVDLVSETAQGLATGATQQAASLQQVRASIVETDRVARTTAEQAREASVAAADARRQAASGDETMSRLAESAREMCGSVHDVASIIDSIEHIALQTNLLALNAAVEAARAGDAGKGFAVVAEEVRSLAHRAASESARSAALVNSAREQAGNMLEATDAVCAGLHSIVTSVETVDDALGIMAAAADGQAATMGEISSSVEHLDDLTQRNAAGAEELAAGAEESAMQVSEVNAQFARFRTE